MPFERSACVGRILQYLAFATYLHLDEKTSMKKKSNFLNISETDIDMTFVVI